MVPRPPAARTDSTHPAAATTRATALELGFDEGAGGQRIPMSDSGVSDDAVTSVPLTDEDGNDFVIAQQKHGAGDSQGTGQDTEGGGEWPDPDTPPRSPAPGSAPA